MAVLGSATPSIESRYNAESGKYHDAAYAGAHRPPADAASRNRATCARSFWKHESRPPFPESCSRRWRSGWRKREQTMLLLNRRGFSSFMVCRACGERLQCTNCAVCLTYHRRDRRMLCHYCGYAERVPTDARNATAIISSFWAPGPNGSRTSCISISRRRALRGWIATASPAKALSSTSCSAFAPAKSTSLSERR